MTDDRWVRRVLLGPGLVRRAAARGAGDRREAWMLRQDRSVRQSYVREVLEPQLERRSPVCAGWPR